MPNPSSRRRRCAAARIAAARNAKIDRSRYEIVRSLERLDAWIAARAIAGAVAFDTETTTLDPMQAELCGFSLAPQRTRPATCRSPIASAATAATAACSPATLRPTRSRSARRSRRMQAAAGGSRRSSRSAEPQIRPADARAARHRARALRRHHADVLRARRRTLGHALTSLSQRYLRPARSTFTEVTGSGKARITFDCVDIENAAEYAAERRRRHAAAVAGAQAAPRRRAREQRLRDAGAPARSGAGAHGAPRHLHRPAGPLAAVGRVRPARRRARGGDPELAGEPFNLGSPKQLGDILFGKIGLPGGTKTKTGAWSTGARRARGSRRAGPSAAAKNSRLAAGLQAQIDLYRRAAGLRQSADPSRAHLLRAGLHHHRPAVLVRAEPAEHSDPHRGRPQDPHAPSSPTPGTSSSRPTIRRSSCGCSPISPRSPQLRQAFRDGLDIHAMTASEMFGVPVQGHAGRRAPPRQGDQFRHHLRHLGLRARQPARHRPRGGRRLYQEIFRALPRHPRLHGRDQALRAQNGYVLTVFGRKCHYPEIAHSESFDARLQRARRHQRARSRARPPTSSAAPWCAWSRRSRRPSSNARDAAAGARRAGLRGARRRGGARRCRSSRR